MDLEEITLAIDVLKDRMCVLEQETLKEETNKINDTLTEAKLIVREVRSIKGNLTKAEQRLNDKIISLSNIQKDIIVTLHQLSDHFGFRRNLNVRIDKVQLAKKLSEKINSIIMEFARDENILETL